MVDSEFVDPTHIYFSTALKNRNIGIVILIQVGIVSLLRNRDSTTVQLYIIL